MGLERYQLNDKTPVSTTFGEPSTFTEPTTSQRLLAEASMMVKSFAPSNIIDAVKTTVSSVAHDPAEFAYTPAAAFCLSAAFAAIDKNPGPLLSTIRTGLGSTVVFGFAMTTAKELQKPFIDTWKYIGTADDNAAQLTDAYAHIGLDVGASLLGARLGAGVVNGAAFSRSLKTELPAAARAGAPPTLEPAPALSPTPRPFQLTIPYFDAIDETSKIPLINFPLPDKQK